MRYSFIIDRFWKWHTLFRVDLVVLYCLCDWTQLPSFRLWKASLRPNLAAVGEGCSLSCVLNWNVVWLPRRWRKFVFFDEFLNGCWGLRIYLYIGHYGVVFFCFVFTFVLLNAKECFMFGVTFERELGSKGERGVCEGCFWGEQAAPRPLSGGTAAILFPRRRCRAVNRGGNPGSPCGDLRGRPHSVVWRKSWPSAAPWLHHGHRSLRNRSLRAALI